MTGAVYMKWNGDGSYMDWKSMRFVGTTGSNSGLCNLMELLCRVALQEGVV